MKKLFKPLTESEVNEINQAIALAEKSTSAEICPFLTRQVGSDNTIYIKYFHFFLLGFFFSLILALLYKLSAPILTLDYTLDILHLVILLTLSLFTDRMVKRKISNLVNVEAELEFEHQGIGETLFSNGVFLYISLLDKRVVVLADTQIKEQTTDETWVKIIEDFQTNIKSSSLKKAIIVAVEEIGLVCSKICPKITNDVNEIKNQITIKG